MDNVKSISFDNINEFSEYYQNNKISKVMTNAVSKVSLKDACFNTDASQKMAQKFSVNIPTMAVTNQKQSGRCWIFSALNIMREKVAKDLNLSEFELSQNFISYYDHLEKANHFLERVIETADMPLTERHVDSLMNEPVGDGGWWEMFVGLCQKYGAVPKEAMPETHHSSGTGSMNKLINTKLHRDAVIIRKAMADKKDLADVRKLKHEMLSEIYNILTICLGTAPETFDFEYVDKDKNYHADRGLTPKQFYDKYIGFDLEEFVTLVNAPMSDKEYNKLYTSASLHVIEGKPITFFNITMDELKEAVIKQLQNGEPLWFACDSGKYSDTNECIWDTNLLDYETPFSIDLGMSKGDMLDFSEAGPTHAMVLTGVNLVDGKPDKWKVENSWGSYGENKGYFVISDDWFNQYVFMATVNKKYLSDAQREYLKQEPIALEPWDHMG